MSYEIKEGFCNLHQHTLESHQDALCDIDDLFDRVKELGQKAVAITDHGSMGGIYRAWKASKRTGVKLIPGNEIYYVTNPDAKSKADEGWKRYHLVLLAMNHQGYKNLLRITYEGFKNSVYVPMMNKVFPRVGPDTLKKYNEGIFCLSACGGNIMAQHLLKKDQVGAELHAASLKEIFGDRFHIELQPHDMKRHGFSQIELNNGMRDIALKLNIPLVATCDAHYIKPDDEKYHDMLLAIADKKPLEELDRHTYTTDILCEQCKGAGYLDDDKKKKCDNAQCVRGITSKIPCVEFYVKSQKEVVDFFTKQYDAATAESLVATASKIADACEPPDYIEPSKNPHIPTFDMRHISQCPDATEFNVWRTKNKLDTAPDDMCYMKFLCWKGFNKYSKDMDREKKDTYWRRLLFELDIYSQRAGFCSYMLIVADYIRWARDNGVLVGPGRGSVGGSLAAFFMNIHRVDPIKYDLLFERFINLEKKSLPDVDSDFAPSGRGKVFDYVRTKYGDEYVASISNLNRFTPKVVIKDIVRSLMIGGNKSDSFRIANQATDDIPNKAYTESGRVLEINTMDLALQHAKGENFKALITKHPEILDYAKFIVGLPRNYSTHAAGVVISDVPLYDIVPVRRDKEGTYAVQYEKNTVEENQLVKMDLLGLITLDVIGETIAQARELGINIKDMEELVDYTNDEGAYKVIGSGNSLCCFQLEGDTLQRLCAPMKAKSIEDIAFINALGRPSCSDEEREEFIARKDGKRKVVAPHPLLQDTLRHTYGISIYEEDLLRLSQNIAGWSLSKADGLRKLTKLKEKGADLAIKLEQDFVADSIKKSGIPKEEADYIWKNVVVPYANYGFNKAHAIAYSMLGYMTAYYKFHARAPFFASVLNAEMTGGATPESADYVNRVKRDCKKFGVSIDVCDINKSKRKYVAVDAKKIVTGLNAVKGVGEGILDEIIANQPYASFDEFVFKNMGSLKRPQVEALAKAGAFDTLGISRKYAHDNFAPLRDELRKFLKKADESFFEDGPDRTRPRLEVLEHHSYSQKHLSTEDWTLQEKLNFEKEVLGEFISGSVSDLYPGFFQGKTTDHTAAVIKTLPDKTKFVVEGMIVGVKQIVVKKKGKNFNKEMAFISIETLKGETIEATMFPDMWAATKKSIELGGIPIRAMLAVNEWQGNKSIVFTDKYTIYKRGPK